MSAFTDRYQRPGNVRALPKQRLVREYRELERVANLEPTPHAQLASWGHATLIGGYLALQETVTAARAAQGPVRPRFAAARRRMNGGAA